MTNYTEKKWFLISTLINFVVFFILNVYSAISEQSKHESAPIKFAHGGYTWGFPFSMYQHYLGYPSNEIGFTPGLIFNLLAFSVAVAFTAIIFIAIESRFRPNQVEDDEV